MKNTTQTQERAAGASQVRGSSIQPGDVIQVWWPPYRDTVTELEPYPNSPFPQGARIARFAIQTGGMSIDNAQLYTVLSGPRPENTAGKEAR